MAKKYNREPVKINPWIVLSLVAVIALLVGMIVYANYVSPKERIYDDYTSTTTAYEWNKEAFKDHIIEKISIKEARELIKKRQEVLIYIGRPGCSVCVQEVGYYSQVVKENAVLKNKGIKTIYYIEVAVDQNQAVTTKGYSDFIKDFEIATGTPQLLLFKNQAVEVSRSTFTQGELEKTVGFVKRIVEAMAKALEE